LENVERRLFIKLYKAEERKWSFTRLVSLYTQWYDT